MKLFHVFESIDGKRRAEVEAHDEVEAISIFRVMAGVPSGHVSCQEVEWHEPTPRQQAADREGMRAVAKVFDELRRLDVEIQSGKVC